MTMWNGLTIALDKLGGASPTTIINFMKAHEFNALRVYTGWGNGKQVTGSFYSGNIYAPLGTWARNFLTDLFAQARANEFLLVVSIADQYTSFAADYPEEVQAGWNGGHSSSNNWIDVRGPNFIIMEANLVREVVELMRDTPGMISWVQIDEMTYTTADSGPAFYAEPMKNAYLQATGKTAPLITSSGSYDTLTADQKQYFDFVRNSIAVFYAIMAQAAYAADSNCRFGAMIDYVWNLPWYLRDVEPFGYYSTLNNLVAEWFYGIQNQIWTGTRSLPDCYTKIWNLNPNAHHYFNYGRITYTNGEATIRRLITEIRNLGYDGGFLYEYYDIRSNTTLNLIDVTGPKPDYFEQPPPPNQYNLVISATIGGVTTPEAGVYPLTENTPQEVVAYPNTNYQFSHWLLDGSVITTNPITVVMNAGHTLQPVFTPIVVILTIATTTVGTTSPTPGVYTIQQGQSQLVTAIAYANYRFLNWTLDGTNPTENPTTVVMDKSYTLTANFEYVPPPPLTATITGKVTDSKTGVLLEGAIVIADGYADVTGTDGLYEFLNIPAQQYTLTVTKEGYQTKTFSVEASEGGSFTADVPLVATPPPTPQIPIIPIVVAVIIYLTSKR